MKRLEQNDNLLMRSKPKLHYINKKKPINYYNIKIKVQKNSFPKDNLLKNCTIITLAYFFFWCKYFYIFLR